MTGTQRYLVLLVAIVMSITTLALALPHATVQNPLTLESGEVETAATPLRIALAAPEPVIAETVPTPQPQPTPPPKPAPQPPAPIPEPAEAPRPEPSPQPKLEPEPETQLTPPVPTPADTPVASAPPVAPAPPAPTELQSGQSDTVDDYLSQLARHLGRHFAYPRRAERLGQEGTPVVRFTFDRSGTLLNWRLEQGSNHVLLDQAALDLLKAAEPLPRVPDTMNGRQFSFTLPVRFRLR